MALTGLAGCGGNTSTAVFVSPTTPAVTPKWIGAWGTSPASADASPDNPGGKEQSFRFLIYPTVGGTQERVRFSNYFGTTPVTIGGGRLAIGKDGSPAIDPANDVKLTFNGGASTITLAPGQIVVSDAVNLTYSFGQTLAVSMYLSGTFQPVSRHSALFSQNYKTVTGRGDATTDAAGAAYTASEGDWLLLNGLDVYGPYQGTIVLFGSSTTDGFKSNYSSNHIYPDPNVPVDGQHTNRTSDWLALTLNAAGYKIGVLNEGIPGATVAADSSNATNGVQPAAARLMRDALNQPSVIAIVSYFGAIDLRSTDCRLAPAIETSTQNVIATAFAAKVPIILATLPPTAFCTNPAQPSFGPTPTPSDPYAGGEDGSLNGSEVQRLAFNTWVKTTGASLPGVAGIADLDKALADPAHPHFMLPPYNSGDNYHPTGAGYKAVSDAIPINAILSSSK